MNTEQKILNNDQKLLAAEIAATYGIDPDEITYFTDDPRPTFGYEATAILCNHLTDIRGIDIEPVNNGFVDSVSYRCTLTRADGSTRSAVGVANVDERDSNDKQLTAAQLIQTASGRAIRNALRVAGIDLLKLHHQSKDLPVEYAGPSRSNWESLLRMTHALGTQAGLIVGTDKTAWRRVIVNRYGVGSSGELTEDQLADFAAVLKTLVPQTRQKAA